MKAIEIISKKRDGLTLSSKEINFMVQKFTEERIPDYQMAAFLMAVYLRGMNQTETFQLTQAMTTSGEVLDLSSIPGVKVDKHSTGGVGDKTTLVLAPLVASTGVPVVKLSGRALGHTGGTIDKLESIPGFRVNLEPHELIQQAKDIGIAIASQSYNLVPADKKIYALRDVTATVSCISLIASSIMSKKLAAGADAIVLDVKTGKGAFMVSKEEALDLARLMITIGKNAGRRVSAVVSDMNQPLGYAIGNSLEVKEAITTLQNRGPNDLRELCLHLGAHMLILADKVKTREEARKILEIQLKEGRAWKKFLELVEAQGGNLDFLLDPEGLPRAQLEDLLVAKESGYIASINARLVGEASLALGAGRQRKEEKIDLSAGIILTKKVGNVVNKNEPLANLYANDSARLKKGKKILSRAFQISKEKPTPIPLIYEVLM